MKIKSLLSVIYIIGTFAVSHSQSIFENTITDTDPNTFNPYTNGQIVAANISASGIGRGSGINENTANNRYNARDWFSTSLDLNDYFEFSITPNSGYKIDFTSFVYKAQVSLQGPLFFTLRSSLDGYISNISSPIILNSGLEVTPTPVDLTAAVFQNCTGTVTFRLYAWGGMATTGTFSINEFTFNGAVSCIAIAPSIGTIIQPNCSLPTGSIQLDGLSVTEPWDLYQNNALIVSGGTGNDINITGLLEGDYSYKISNGYCSSAATEIISIKPLTTCWDGSTWSNGVPTDEHIILFNGNYTSTTDLVGCSCQVNSGDVVINSGYTLSLNNELSVNGGSFTFENNASLIQTNDAAVNSGNINYKRITTPILKYDYTYWSSPVLAFTLGGVSPNTLWDKYYSFDPDTDYWHRENSTAEMIPGKGYIIRGPQNFSTTVPNLYTSTFIGIPNNGLITYPNISADKNYIIGNPYPSALDADAFLSQNSSVLNGTLAFWTHNTALQLASNITNGSAGTGIYAYTSDDYAYYNLTGGIGTGAASSGGVIPNGKIASGQSFGATSKAAGTIIFNNSMRVGLGGITGDNSQFFKNNKNAKTSNAIEKNRIWLNLTNNQGAFKQTLIGYITGATNEYDNMFDEESLDGNNYIDFYSLNQNQNLTIQGRSLPFENKDEVALGYRTNIEGEFSITIEQVDGVFLNHKLYIQDRTLDSIHDLKESPYKFDTQKGLFNNRFVLVYKKKNRSKTKTKQAVDYDNTISLFVKNNQIQINSTIGIIDKIIIYDISGNEMYKKSGFNSEEYIINNLKAAHQVLLVKVILENKKTITKKIIY